MVATSPTTAAAVERELLEWTVAWTALSASWFADDGRSDEEQRVLRIGALARARLGFR